MQLNFSTSILFVPQGRPPFSCGRTGCVLLRPLSSPLYPLCDHVEAKTALAKHLAGLPQALRFLISERQPLGERPSSLSKLPSSAFSHSSHPLPNLGSTFLRMFRGIKIDCHQRV